MSRVALFALLLAACTAHEAERPLPGPAPAREQAAAEAITWTRVTTRAQLQAAVEAAGASRPIVIEVCAAWAMACVELEQRTLVDPAVVAELRRFTAIAVDVTEDSPSALQELLAAPSVPYVQVYGPGSGLARALAQAGGALPRPTVEVKQLVPPGELAPLLAAVR